MPPDVMHYLPPSINGTRIREMGRDLRDMTTNDGTEPPAVMAPDDERLPTVHPERYGAFDIRTGETVLYDSDAKGAWIRADCAVEPGR
jgi:hypothetical protein